MKKITAILLSVVVIILSIMPTFASNGSTNSLGVSGPSVFGIIDTEKPKLETIKLDKRTVSSPDKITITANASDKISGVEQINLIYSGKEHNRYIMVSLWNFNMENSQFSDHFTGEIDIDQNVISDEYICTNISVVDRAGNQQQYINPLTEWDMQDGHLPMPNNLSFIVQNTNDDIEAPKLTSIRLDKTEVNAPGKIIVTAQATDNLSGVSNIGVGFYLEDPYRSQSISLSNKKWNYETNEEEILDHFEGEFEIEKYTVPGNYICDSIVLEDYAGNTQYYTNIMGEWEMGAEWLPLPTNLSFVVNNSFNDRTKPEITKAKLNKNIVEAPGTIEITAEATDDISGVNYISFRFYCEETGKEVYASLNNISWNPETGEQENLEYFKDTITLNTYTLPGTYTCTEISVYDNAGNMQSYSSDLKDWEMELGYLQIPFNLSFDVLNDNTPDYSSNLNDPQLIQNIKDLPNDSKVALDISSNGNAPAELFESIKGTDKTISFIDDGIEWIFNGNDINTIKPIDLKVGITPVEEFPGGEAISNNVDGAPTVVLSFANNGQLPGKAKIRVKADYEFRQYLGEENLYVYYYDNTQETFELVKSNVNVTSDGYIEFEINHNSIYLVTNQFIKENTTGNGNSGNGNTNAGNSNTNAGNNNTMHAGFSYSDSKDQGTTKKDRRLYMKKDSTKKICTKNDMQIAFDRAMAEKTKENHIEIELMNYDEISADALAAVNSLAATNSVTVTIHCDTIEKNKVVSRISFDPKLTQKDMNVTVSSNNNVLLLFDKFYTNELSTITVADNGVLQKIAIPISEDADTSKLTLYKYNVETNVYTQQECPIIWKDKNSYIHFEIEQGGTYILSQGELKSK